MPPNYLIPICRRATPSSILFPSARHFQTSSFSRLPRKDSQDRNSINTEATEYSKSGTDDAAAKQDDAAYDPNVTDPGKEKDVAGAGNEKSGNPLNVSPANQEVSKPRSGTEGGAERAAGGKNQSSESKGSGHGSPQKNAKTS